MVCNPTSQHHNINNYLDLIQQKIGIIIAPFKIIGPNSCTKNVHFLIFNPNKLIFHKNLNSKKKNLDVCLNNKSLVDDIPYKNLLNGPFNVIFVKTVERFSKDDNYLV